jgi:hypothetical protein
MPDGQARRPRRGVGSAPPFAPPALPELSEPPFAPLALPELSESSEPSFAPTALPE